MDNDMFAQQVRAFIEENYLFGRDKTFSDHDSFLDLGIIDSTAILELVLFLEESYGIVVEDGELTPDNLDSINNVTRYLRAKTNGSSMLSAPAERIA